MTTLSSLPTDTLTESFSYLKYPEVLLSVSKSMREPVQQVLHKRISSPFVNFFTPFQESFNRRFGTPSIDNYRAVTLRMRNIRNSAIRLIQQAAPLLSEAEGAQVDPTVFSSRWDFDKIATAIRDQRSENLVSFFTWLGSQNETAQTFLDSLSPVLSSYGKAGLIRNWMRENRELLQGIIEIDLDEVFPEQTGMPVEILDLPNLNMTTLGAILGKAAKDGNLEVVRRLFIHPQFDDIAIWDLNLGVGEAPATALGGALCTAIAYERSEIAKELICSRGFDQIDFRSLEKAVRTSMKDELSEIFTLLVQSPRFALMPQDFLGTILQIQTEHGDPKYVKRLIDLGVLDRISVDSFDSIFQAVAGKGYHEILNSLINHQNFQIISTESVLPDALINAAANNHLKAVQSLVGCGKFDEIPEFLRKEASNIAAKKGYLEIFQAIPIED